MSGVTLVGVRLPSGREHVWEQANGPLSWRICDPTVFNRTTGWRRWQRAVNEGTATPKSERSWGTPVRQPRIHPSEYGVVFIDFRDKVVFARQDYMNPLHFGVDLEPVTLTRIEALHAAGMIDHFSYLNPNRDDLDVLYLKTDASETEWLLGIFRQIPTGKVTVTEEQAERLKRFERLWQMGTGFYVELKLPEGWTFDTGQRASGCWPEVKRWLAAHKWTSPVQQRVR
jgi:hypothetical protein